MTPCRGKALLVWSAQSVCSFNCMSTAIFSAVCSTWRGEVDAQPGTQMHELLKSQLVVNECWGSYPLRLLLDLLSWIVSHLNVTLDKNNE